MNAIFSLIGYNVLIVALGAMLLGASGGAVGAYLYVSRRALLSDAVAHATLPGLCLAFILMTALGGEGRWLPGLMLGSLLSAGLGTFIVSWMDKNSPLGQEAAIGTVLSVFFGFGTVLLTIIQAIPAGYRAGLEVFLFGSVAGMQRADLWLLVFCASLSLSLALLLRKPLTLITFDPGYAKAIGFRVDLVNLVLLGLTLGVVVTGMRLIGLILIVAMLIIPPSTARLWCERMHSLIIWATFIGAVSALLGVILSATLPNAPTGSLIVLCSFFFFVISLLISPKRGLVANLLSSRSLAIRVHKRQGLLALARNELIFDRFTRKVLWNAGLIYADGEPTASGYASAKDALHQEQLMALARQTYRDDELLQKLDGLKPLSSLLTPDQIATLEAKLAI